MPERGAPCCRRLRAFLEAYQAALEAEPTPIRGKAKPRTIAALVDLDCHSRKWTELQRAASAPIAMPSSFSSPSMVTAASTQMEAKHVAAIMEAQGEHAGRR